MRCLACCTAQQYQLDQLSQFFQTQTYQHQYFGNVLHVQNTEKAQDIFLFRHGCVVMWGLSRQEEQNLLSQLHAKNFAVDMLAKRECHVFLYKISENTTITASTECHSDIITIDEKESDNILLKVAISYGLSQSVKLRSHEISIKKIVAENRPISQELAHRGHISLSRKSIFKRIGEIFLAKSSVNLSNEYLDVSEYFWRYPHLEPYYLMVEKFLDIQKRVSILNQRLDVVHDVVIMLNNQLEHRYSSTLEIIIIVLICAELIMSVLSLYCKM